MDRVVILEDGTEKIESYTQAEKDELVALHSKFLARPIPPQDINRTSGITKAVALGWTQAEAELMFKK